MIKIEVGRKTWIVSSSQKWIEPLGKSLEKMEAEYNQVVFSSVYGLYTDFSPS